MEPSQKVQSSTVEIQPDEEMAASSLEGSRAHLKFAVGLGAPPPTSSSEDCEGRIVRCWICAQTASDYQCWMEIYDRRKRNDKDTSRQN